MAILSLPSPSALLQHLDLTTIATGLLVTYLGSKVLERLVDYFTTDVHDLPTPSNYSWIWGHEMMAFVRSCGDQYREWFDEHGSVYRIRAAFQYGDIITTSDAGVINHVFGKKIYQYEKSPMIRPVAERLVGHGVVWAEGETHRRQRALLNPAFTNENVKNMAPTVLECTERFVTALETHLLSLPGADGMIDMQEWTAKTTLDIIGRTGFGHDFQLGSSPEAERILKSWKNQATMGFGRGAMFGLALLRCFPILSAAPVPALKAQEYTRNTIKEIARGIVQQARDEMTDDGEWGATMKGATDIISLLLKAHVTDNGLSEDELLDNIVTFVVAGHETASGTINYTLHELSQRPDLQQRLRQELSDFRAANDGREPTFDEYMNASKLPFLDAVMKEAMRKYPVASFTERTATQDDVIPLRTPVTTRSGKVLTELRIRKGQTIFFPVISINRINSVWGDGEVFRPERYLAENAADLPNKHLLPSSGWNGSLTFSAGSRLCIGIKLALFEYKVILASLIRRFEFHDSNIKLEFRVSGSLQPRVVGREDEGVQLPIRMTFVQEE